MADQKPVCLVMGAGAGLGGHVGKRFAEGGYHAVLCRRSDEEGLNKLVADIEEAGGSATGRLINAVEDDVIENLVEEVERDIGPIETVIFNLGAQIGDRDLADTSYKAFELGWRMATFAFFRLAHALTPKMVERGHGTIIATSATAAVRGNAGQHSHAAAVGGRRMFCQSLNAEFGPKNIHIAHVVVDGPIEAPDTLGKLLGPERYEKLLDAKGRGKDEMLLPAQMAETYFHLAHQHRSAWTFEIDLRPFTDKPWWNG